MKYNFICTFIITVVLTGCSSKPVSITSLEMLNSIDSSNFEGKKIRYKVDFFLVDGYQNDDNTRKILDSFIEKHKVVDFTKVDQYEMIFYKESAETNSKNILSNPRVIDRYSQQHDLVYTSSWKSGKFFRKERWKNGKIIDPLNNFSVEPIPK